MGACGLQTGNGVVRLDPRKLNAPRPPASVLIEEPVVDGNCGLWLRTWSLRPEATG